MWLSGELLWQREELEDQGPEGKSEPVCTGDSKEASVAGASNQGKREGKEVREGPDA